MYPYLNQMYGNRFQNFNMMQGFESIGKFVDGIETVRVTDIPMDGRTYYFPKADGTEVFSKKWNDNGTTQINTFKIDFKSKTSISTPSEEKAEIEQNASDYFDIQEHLKNLEERIAVLEAGNEKKTKK